MQNGAEGTRRELQEQMVRSFLGPHSSSSERLKPVCMFGWLSGWTPHDRLCMQFATDSPNRRSPSCYVEERDSGRIQPPLGP
eukprot:9222419-Alexandrium_andersonii.AAC.1